MKVTSELLISAGYKRYAGSDLNRSSALYQKRISDNHGTKYFINAWFHDYTRYNIQSPNQYSFEFEVQFTKKDGSKFNVDDLSDSTIEEHEKFFESIWTNLEETGYHDD